MTDWTYANPLPYATSLYGGLWGRMPIEVQASDTRQASSPEGQPVTRQQTRPLWSPLGYGVPACPPGMNIAPPGGYGIWDAMDADPALTLARGVLTAPIREAGKSYDAREGTPDEWINEVKADVEPLWDEFLAEALSMLSKGWKPFETVFGRRDGQTAIVDLKPLAPELSHVLTKDGAYYGVRNDRGRDNQYIDLPAERCFVATCDGKNRDLYGRPLHENARQSWWEKLHVLSNLAKLNKKASGIQASIYYPPAADEDTAHTNEAAAQTLLKKYMQGDGIVLPNAAGMLNSDLAADYRNIAGFAESALWKVQLEDHGNIGPQAAAMLDQLRYLNAELSRAWYVPERSSQEAVTAGSRTDSESAGDIALQVAQLIYNGICAAFSRGPIDTRLVQNRGERARGAVTLTGGKLRDVYAAGDWILIEAFLAQPDLLFAIADQIDVDAVFTRRGIPKVAAILTLQKAIEDAKKAKADAAAALAAKPLNVPDVAPNGKANGKLAMSRETERRAEELVEGLAMLGRINGDDEHNGRARVAYTPTPPRKPPVKHTRLVRDKDGRVAETFETQES